MNDLKIPNNSYKPKQLLYRCFEEEDFQDVIIIGITKAGALKLHKSTEAFNVIAMFSMFLQKITLDLMHPQDTTKK